ncbi:hypothetical protein J22TS1_07800 [Siminovitchia terrae]|uniref:hypothetical protein n=1 Tax=Siminovitchia terrae TaxID=1914933 RepID=UPI001B2E82ED|nr:hypothetical protein [Siminovitchia terrae]GIN89729.1 hypothetical protein J22TS1_07800 [Siminovitchia terrae]
MRINEKGRNTGAALPNTDGLHLQNLLEKELGEVPASFENEYGWDHSDIQFLKRGLERG